ncbi:MAG: SMP-30/gluconolactonase/LRE family protein [Saprospiraceae bacterium]
MCVHPNGTIFGTGPGGVLVFSPEGKHLGTIETGEAIANCCFDTDHKTLFMTSDMASGENETEMTSDEFRGLITHPEL